MDLSIGNCKASNCSAYKLCIPCLTQIMQGSTSTVQMVIYDSANLPLDLTSSDYLVQVLLYNEFDKPIANFKSVDDPKISLNIDSVGEYLINTTEFADGIITLNIPEAVTNTQISKIYAELKLIDQSTGADIISKIGCFYIGDIIESKIFKYQNADRDEYYQMNGDGYNFYQTVTTT